MPLTPADVHNVAFSKPPIGKRGYNEDEVDAFLDLVEAELARLIEENNDLREQVEQLDQQLGNAQADLEDARSATGHGRAADPADPAPVEPRRCGPWSRRRRDVRAAAAMADPATPAATTTCRPPRCWAWPRRWPTG